MRCLVSEGQTYKTHDQRKAGHFAFHSGSRKQAINYVLVNARNAHNVTSPLLGLFNERCFKSVFVIFLRDLCGVYKRHVRLLTLIWIVLKSWKVFGEILNISTIHTPTGVKRGGITPSPMGEQPGHIKPIFFRSILQINLLL